MSLIGKIVESAAALMAVSKAMSSVNGTPEGVQTEPPTFTNRVVDYMMMVTFGFV
jgi:hypothetical protein